MKERQVKILEYVFNSNGSDIDKLVDLFEVSKRTLYYDLSFINDSIKEFGRLKNIRGSVAFVGDNAGLETFLYADKSDVNKDIRQNSITLFILEDKMFNIESLVNDFQVSKNTIVNDIADIKSDLGAKNLRLKYDKKYFIEGDEHCIRELFINCMMKDSNLLSFTSNDVKVFDKENSLYLTDYSIALLSRFVNFLKVRIPQNSLSESPYELEEARKFSYFPNVDKLINTDNINEYIYLTLYIATLPRMNISEGNSSVISFVNKLILNFENISSIEILNKEEFKKNIYRHLETSYNRIKYNFPGFNPILYDIKNKHLYLFELVKKSIKLTNDSIFSEMRDEEIGFIVMYIGGNIDNGLKLKNKVVIVCPNGLATSKTLETQLLNYIPNIEIIDSIPLYNVEYFKDKVDFFVSTVNIPNLENVIIVKPFLSVKNIRELTEKILQTKTINKVGIIDEIVSAVEKYSEVKNKKALTRELENIIFNNNVKGRQPMLQEVLTRDRIHKVECVNDWKEAIKLASSPLLEDGSIEESYITEMIESVEKHGPYIVLEDYFALPHSTSKNGVNEFAMSLLQLGQEVDLLGKPVKVFVVLAAIDNQLHLKALSALSNILEEEENLNIFIGGSTDEILELIEREEEGND